MPAPDDWLGAEALIIDRLTKEVGAWVRAILGARELATLGEGQQQSPSLHVLYWGELPSGNDAGHGEMRMVTQQWMVATAVESARDIANGAGERITVGQLMSHVINALRGYQPAEGFKPIRRHPSAPAPEFATPWAYYPLLFDVTFAGA